MENYNYAEGIVTNCAALGADAGGDIVSTFIFHSHSEEV